MSALSDAIARARPSSTLAAVSPLHGLRRGSVKTVDLVAQSVAAVAPAGVLLTQTNGLVARAGSFAYLELLLTAATVVLVALSMSVFARRIAASAGIYTFVTRGLGPTVGMIAGSAIVLGYAAVAMDTLRSGARRVGRLIEGAVTQPLDAGATVGIAAVCGALIAVVIALGARTSTRIMLVIESVAVAGILIVSTAVFASTGWNLSGLVPDWSEAPDPSAMAGGIGIALVAFVGFESGAALAPESRRPLATVPRALIWTVTAIAVVYLFGVAAQLSAEPADGGRPVSLLAEAELLANAAWVDPAIQIVIAASWIVCTLAFTNALVRLVFSLAREGVLPATLGRTSARFAIPHVATVAVATAVTAGAALLLWTGRDTLFAELVSLSTSMGFIIAYFLVCAAAVPFLTRLGEFSMREAWAALGGSVALAGIIAVQLWAAAVDGWLILGAFALIIASTAAVHHIRCRTGSVLRAQVGAYDRPVSTDALTSAGEEPASR